VYYVQNAHKNVEQEKEITEKEITEKELDKKKLLFISKSLIRSKYLSREQVKKITLALKKTKEQSVKVLRSIMISKKLSLKMTKALMKSGLTRGQLKILLNLLSKMLKLLFTKPFDRISLHELMSFWHLLPEPIKMLLVAMQVLKDEMMHLHRLEVEKRRLNLIKENGINQQSGAIDINSIENQRSSFFPDLKMQPNIRNVNFKMKKETKKEAVN